MFRKATELFEYGDIDRLIDVAKSAGYDCRYVQLEPGRIKVRNACQTLGEISIVQEQVSHSLEFCGAPPTDQLSVMLLGHGTSFRANGIRPGPHSLVIAPPGVEINIVTGGFVNITTVSIRSDLVLQYCPPERPPSAVRGTSVYELRTDPFKWAELETALSACRWCGSDPVLQSAHETEVVQCIARIVSARRRNAGPGSTRLRARRDLLDAACNYISARLGDAITISELARETGASERTLERAFRQEMSLSPSRYILLRRLEAVRRELASGPGRPRNITSVALNNGFNHLGRFSREFRHHFGLLPNQLAGRR
jgi:AraC-like DNA-binding protein